MATMDLRQLAGRSVATGTTHQAQTPTSMLLTRRWTRREKLVFSYLALIAVTACRLLLHTASLSSLPVEQELISPSQTERRPRFLVQDEPDGNPGPFTFSACLLIKDDNRILPEWLAFHYTTLPLRHVVVAVDPFSLTDPTLILDEWKRELNLRVDLWHDDDYMVYNEIPRPRQKDAGTYKIAAHRKRQPRFYQACLEHLQRENRTWTVLIDTDEYFVRNSMLVPGMQEERCERQRHNTTRHYACLDRLRMLSGFGNNSSMTVADFIDRDIGNGETLFANSTDRPCIMAPRIFFGGQESEPEEIALNVPSGFNVSLFDTLRFRKYLRHSLTPQWPGKSLVDASRFSGRVDNAHRVMSEKMCSGHAFPDAFTSVFRVQHYLGSLHDFLNRPGDSRRTSEKYSLFSNSGGGRTIINDDTRPWLEVFVNQVGPERARRLTQEARLRAEMDDIMRVQEATHSEEPVSRSFIRYIASSWEILWYRGIVTWQNQSICPLLEAQAALVDEFLRSTCSFVKTNHGGEYCEVGKGDPHRFCYNLSDSRWTENIARRVASKRGSIEAHSNAVPLAVDMDKTPLVLSTFVYENEETGELYADYIEPLVANLYHPLENHCFHGRVANGPCPRMSSGGNRNDQDGTQRRLLADVSRLPAVAGRYFYGVGAADWNASGRSLATATDVWKSYGVEFDAYYVWGLNDKERFYASVPERLRERVTYFEQPTIRLERDNTVVQNHAPMFIRETRSRNDYVVLHLLNISDEFDLSMQFDFLDDLIWKEHNYVEWIDELVWSGAGSLELVGAYDYITELRRRGVRAHAYL